MTAPTRGLTYRQQAIVTFIRDWREQHDYAPTLREIAKGADLASPSAASYQVRLFRAAGVVRYTDRKQRTVYLVDEFAGGES